MRKTILNIFTQFTKNVFTPLHLQGFFGIAKIQKSCFLFTANIFQDHMNKNTLSIYITRTAWCSAQCGRKILTGQFTFSLKFTKSPLGWRDASECHQGPLGKRPHLTGEIPSPSWYPWLRMLPTYTDVMAGMMLTQAASLFSTMPLCGGQIYTYL